MNGVLRIRVAAPPVDGAANRALLRLLAAELHAPRRDLRLIGGEGGRSKLVAVDGPAAEAVRARWPDLRR